MQIIIDTTQPLTDQDKTLLTTLLDKTPTRQHAPNPTEHIAATIAANTPPNRRTTTSITDAKQPITNQAGVRTRESTTDDN